MKSPGTVNFTLAEFVATSHQIRNELPESLYPAAQRTLEMLQRVRNLIGQPLIITSGYRCPALNTVVGGVTSSDHMDAEAADVISPAFGTPLQLAQVIESKIDSLGIGQLIYEITPRTSWVHLSIRLNKRNRIITANNGRYFQGVRAK